MAVFLRRRLARALVIFALGFVAGAWVITVVTDREDERVAARDASAPTEEEGATRADRTPPPEPRPTGVPMPAESTDRAVTVFDAPARADAAWAALVSGTLEQEVERRLGVRLEADRKARLLDALARMREASLGLQDEVVERPDEQALRERLGRQLVLLEVDRTFRDELGIGVAEFLQGLDSRDVDGSGAVQDVQATPEAR